MLKFLYICWYVILRFLPHSQNSQLIVPAINSYLNVYAGLWSNRANLVGGRKSQGSLPLYEILLEILDLKIKTNKMHISHLSTNFEGMLILPDFI